MANQYACRCSDGRISIVNVKRSVVENHWKAHDEDVLANAMGTDGTLLVSGSADNTTKVWNVEECGLVACFSGHSDYVIDVALIGDDRRVVSVSSDSIGFVWNPETGQIVSEPFGGETTEIVGCRQSPADWTCFGGYTNWVRCVSVSGDGRRLISGPDDKNIRVWNLESQAEICDALEGHFGMVSGVSFVGGIHRLVSCYSDGAILVWDVTRKVSKKLTNRREDIVMGLSFIPDGRLVSGSWDKTLRVWNTTSGQQVGDSVEALEARQ